MKILKRLFVGSIVLVLLTTSLLVTAGVNEKIDIANISVNSENYLGDLVVVHQPWLFSGPAISEVGYTAPENNPTFQYYFPEDENGYVNMNFTLNVTHELNDPAIPYFADLIFPDEFRFTVVKLWINHAGDDYIIDLNSTNCYKFFPETYTLHLSDGELLKTDGATKEGTFWWTIWPGIGPFPRVHEYIMPLLPPFMTGITVGHEDIFINPT